MHPVGANLTRTFALRDSRIPTQALEKWFRVQTAQQVAARSMWLQGMSLRGRAWASGLLIDSVTVRDVIH